MLIEVFFLCVHNSTYEYMKLATIIYREKIYERYSEAIVLEFQETLRKQIMALKDIKYMSTN